MKLKEQKITGVTIAGIDVTHLFTTIELENNRHYATLICEFEDDLVHLLLPTEKTVRIHYGENIHYDCEGCTSVEVSCTIPSNHCRMEMTFDAVTMVIRVGVHSY